MMIKKTESNPVVDCGLCPLCGDKNYCEVDKGTDCWCRSETFTEQLLFKVPDDRKQKACICRNCVRGFAGSEG